jgi:hypothetical protein
MKRTKDWKSTEDRGRSDAPLADRRWPLSRMPFKIGCVLFLGVVLMAAQQSGQAPGPGTAAVAQSEAQQSETQKAGAANAQRKTQIADDTAKLLKLATDLKTEVDKTDKDTLSVNVIRKAGEIEKLAHSVREKTKSTAAVN